MSIPESGPKNTVPAVGVVLIFLLLWLSGCATVKTESTAASEADWAEAEWAQEENWLEEEWPTNGRTVSDPLEPVNRVFFVFNDKLYFWVLKPAATAYSHILPEDIRFSVFNAFQNLKSPVRVVNNLLQGKLKDTGIELSRFVINSTLGIGGLADPAKNEFGLVAKEEDFGQTLGMYGLGPGVYIYWPFLGPSNIRDTFGRVGDYFTSPVSYVLANDEAAGILFASGERVNKTSLTLGNYEQFKDAAFDPYLAVRDAYQQNRESKIKDTLGQAKDPSCIDKNLCIPF